MAKPRWLLLCCALIGWPALGAAQPDDGEGGGEAVTPIDEDEPAGMVGPEDTGPADPEGQPDGDAGDPGADPPVAPGAAPGVEIHGFVSLGYTLNVMKPTSGLNALRVFDVGHNTVTLDVAELVVQRVPTAPGQGGFRVDVAAGQTVPPLTGSPGLSAGEHVDLQQAFASWVAPVGEGLRLDAGKFVTWAGAEVIEGYDGYNDHYSHSWLFGYAIPFTHLGVRGGYAVSPKLTVSAMVANGWDVAEDNNAGKTWGLNAAIAATARTRIYLTYLGGPEQTGDSGNLRNVVDAVAVLNATDEVTVSFNATFGHEALAVDSATWYGAALYGRYHTGGRFSVAMRGELFGDPDGHRMGLGEQTLIGLTVTPAYKLDGTLVIRGDLRFDHSTEEVFADQDQPSANQLTLGLNVIGML